MKQFTFIFTPECKWVTETWPEKPECNCDVDGAGDFEGQQQRCNERFKAYDKAVEQAKASAIKCDEQTSDMVHLIVMSDLDIRPGAEFDLKNHPYTLELDGEMVRKDTHFRKIGTKEWISWIKEIGGNKRIPSIYEYREVASFVPAKEEHEHQYPRTMENKVRICVICGKKENNAPVQGVVLKEDSLYSSQFNGNERINHFFVNVLKQLTSGEIGILIKALSKYAPSPPQESQSELWEEVSGGYAFEYIPDQRRYLNIPQVMKHFTITRKPQ